MTKKASIALMCVITVIALFFGIFAFIFDGQEVGIDYYHTAYGLIQKSSMFGDVLEANYQIKLDEGVKSSNATIKVIKSRLQSIYSYYSVGITENAGTLTFDLPKDAKAASNTNGSVITTDEKVSANITRNGKVEILNAQVSGSLPTYSESAVVLSASHLRSVSTRTYSSNGTHYYICQARLTKEGNQLLQKAKLTEGTSYCYAIDGTTTHIAVYQSGKFQLYSASKTDSKALASYIKYGELNATLTYTDSDEVTNNTGWIFVAAMGVVILATFVFMAVRYKTLGLAGILSQLIATIAFLYAAGFIALSTFNLFAVIALVLAYAFMTFFTILTFERIRTKSAEKTFATAAYYGFRSTNIASLIAHGALLVLGIILWVIPTAVTAPMGTVLVYGAVLSFVATFALNRLFVKFVEPFYETSGKTIAKK